MTALLLLGPLLKCGDPVQPFQQPGESIETLTVIPALAGMEVDDTLMLQVLLTNKSGIGVKDAPIRWTSLDGGVVTVTSAGLVRAVSPGLTFVTARSGKGLDATEVRVFVPVAGLRIANDTYSVAYASTLRVEASAVDAKGAPITDRSPGWKILDTSLASVNASGLVVALSDGSTGIEARLGGQVDTAVLTVRSLGVFASIEAGEQYACGVTTQGDAYCWGANGSGQLGDGSVETAVRPARVLGGLVFAAVQLSGDHACGATVESEAFCWGDNSKGDLGIVSGERCAQGRFCSTRPLKVKGGLQLASISTGSGHTCGVTGAGEAHCWGVNSLGQLGDGTTDRKLEPEPVSGGLSFRSVQVGADHTCGLDAGGKAHCWGSNSVGQIGDGGPQGGQALAPVAVAGALEFQALTVFVSGACALGVDEVLYCWGDGQAAPARLDLGLQFESLSSGPSHTCGLTFDGQVYCWGDNEFGQLGIGDLFDRATPTAVSGGLTFTAISVGAEHTCGLTTDGAHCWGRNDDGELGVGARSPLAVLSPRRVSGQ